MAAVAKVSPGGGLSGVAGLSCVLAVAFCAAGTVAAEPAGSVAAEYDRLRESGCDPAAFAIATSVEARVLRNLPFARAGLRFRAAELAALYRADGDWYAPVLDTVELAADDQACVSRLLAHEQALRRQLPIDPAVEAVLVARPEVFWMLRKNTRYPNRYQGAFSGLQSGSWSWGFQDGAACGGDGSPESAGDCAGFAVLCSDTAGAGAPADIHCEWLEAG